MSKTKDLQPITKSFLTYNSKQDPYNTSQAFLISGSKNMIISDLEKVKSRQGFSLQSTAGISGSTIPGSTDWEDSTGDIWSLRALSTEARLEFLINGAWETLMDTLSSTNLIFSPYWDDTEKIDRMLWCDGSVNVYDWSGATTTLASITATTVTCAGTKTFGQQRFLTTGTRAIRIKDDNGTWHRSVYTAGEASQTLTGLATDLTSFPFTNNNLIVQEVVTRANYVSSVYKVDIVDVIDNQAWTGSRSSNAWFVSKNSAIADFSFSTPRAVGEGAQLNLDGPGRAVGVLRGDVILHAGAGNIYKSQFNQITVGSSLAETLKVVRIKSTGQQAALHQNLIAEIGNGLVWIGSDNVMYELLDATLAYNPDLRAISDPVKPDFDATDFGPTSGNWGHVSFFKTRIYISAPASSINFIYEFRINDKQQKEWFWQPPLTMPVKRWAVISGLIHGHSSQASETYKLFDGYRDLNGPINAVVELGRWNGGVREMLKDLDEMFNEGACTPNTVIVVTYKFELDGGDQVNVYKEINPLKNTDIVYPMSQDPSLGNLALGDISLSGDILSVVAIPRFRIIHEIEPEPIFDYGVRFETNDLDQQWELMCHGSNATLSTGKPTAIKV